MCVDCCMVFVCCSLFAVRGSLFVMCCLMCVVCPLVVVASCWYFVVLSGVC